jgi:hypothetical protein
MEQWRLHFSSRSLHAPDELGAEWTLISERLHQIAETQDETGEICNGLIDISRRAMIELSRAGVLGDWRRLDFNISEVNDSVDLVVHRNKMIHEHLQQ